MVEDFAIFEDMDDEDMDDGSGFRGVVHEGEAAEATEAVGSGDVGILAHTRRDSVR